jgi:hypothetical protein
MTTRRILQWAALICLAIVMDSLLFEASPYVIGFGLLGLAILMAFWINRP